MESNPYPKATFSIRTTAMVIDLFSITFLQVLFGSCLIVTYRLFCELMQVPSRDSLEEILSQFSGVFLFLGYFTAVPTLFGNTLGKHVCSLKIVSQKTFQPLTPLGYFQRACGYILSSWTYGVGFFMAYFRRDQLALHDLVCYTQVCDVSQTAPQLLLPLDYVEEETGSNPLDKAA